MRAAHCVLTLRDCATVMNRLVARLQDGARFCACAKSSLVRSSVPSIRPDLSFLPSFPSFIYRFFK